MNDIYKFNKTMVIFAHQLVLETNMAYPSNSAYDCVFNSLYKNVYDKQPNAIHPFGVKSH
jgi:hypothetical protein